MKENVNGLGESVGISQFASQHVSFVLYGQYALVDFFDEEMICQVVSS
jgi:hypothetical protein